MTDLGATVAGAPRDCWRSPNVGVPPPVSSRRLFLQTLTAGGSLAFAGCGLGGLGASSDDETADSTDRTLRIPESRNAPDKTSFFFLGSDLAFAGGVEEKPSMDLAAFVREPGLWLDRSGAPATLHRTWIDDVEKTPTEITLTIGEDARWSDGHRITGRDIAIAVIDNHIRRFFFPFYATEFVDEPTALWGAFDDFEIGEQSVTYRSSPGHFERFWDSTVRSMATYVFPTHTEPYAAYTDAVIETVRRAQAGEITPWNPKPWEGDELHTRGALKREYLDKQEYVDRFSEPENVLSAGAWDLVELRGSEAFVFEVNTHHRQADSIDFDRVVLEYTPSEERQRAALRSDRLDYGSVVTPGTVVESFPSALTELLVPGGWGSGNELGLNFHHPALASRPVRRAIAYALDQAAIATNIHRTAAEPITTPGGDCWDATDYVDQSWIDDHLTTYGTDRGRATTLLREAGYTNEDGGWRDQNGEPLEFTLATDSESPRWEPSVASQLTEFGIDTDVRTLPERTFRDRVEAGEFPLWAGGGSISNVAAATFTVWAGAAQNPAQYGIFPDDQFEVGHFSDQGTPIPRTEDRWGVFTIEAPPVGEPDGSLQEYRPAAYALSSVTNPPEAEFRERVKTGLWLANWYLPTIPINRTLEQHFVDDANWAWPRQTRSWENFTAGGPRSMAGILASGTVRANPDNPSK